MSNNIEREKIYKWRVVVHIDGATVLVSKLYDSKQDAVSETEYDFRNLPVNEIRYYYRVVDQV